MPLMLLGSLNTIIGVIQQGCEMYSEYKGTIAETVDQAKKTYNQVQEISTEVKSFWTFVKEKLFGKPPDPVEKLIEKQAEQATENVQLEEPQTLDEVAIYNNIAKNLIRYFNLIEQIEAKLREAEEDSRDLTKHKNPMESALMRVLIKERLIMASAKLREVMCWNTPRELGALYEKVMEMRSVVLQEQEEVRQKQKQEQRMKEWRLTQIKHQIIDDTLLWVGVTIFVLEIWSLWMVLNSHRG